MPISERVEAMTMPLLIAIVTETSKKNFDRISQQNQ